MPTIITGPVRLPDGTIPAHGRIIFRRRHPRIDSPLVVPGPVEALIGTDGSFEVTLDGEVEGTPYAVTVEYFDDTQYVLRSVLLPDAVPGQNVPGPVSLASVSAVPVPSSAGTAHVINQGETLDVGLQYLDENNRAASISDVEITSWLGRADTPRTNLSVAKTAAAAGQFEISLPAAQTELLRGTYEWVIRMSAGARVKIKTGTLIVNEVPQ